MTISPATVNSAPELKDDERGLIISPMQFLDGKDIDGNKRGEWKYRSRLPGPEELRRGIFLWDKIDVPLTHINTDEDAYYAEYQFLTDAGVLFRSPQPLTYVPDMSKFGTPQFQYNADYSPETVASNYLHTFRQRERRQPGRWAMGISRDHLKLPKSELEAGRGLLVRLNNAIPIPDRNTPLNELLDFRRTRKAELLGLRTALDSLYIDILNSPDRPLAEALYLARLDKALSGIVTVSEEAPFKLQPASLEATINAQTIGAGIAVSALASAAALPPTAIVIAGLATTIFASVKATFGIKYTPHSKGAFRYVLSMRDDS